MNISKVLTWLALLIVSVTTAVHSKALTKPERVTHCRIPGVVAYTFDDGPGKYNNLLLAKLDEKNVTATFFVM